MSHDHSGNTLPTTVHANILWINLIVTAALAGILLFFGFWHKNEWGGLRPLAFLEPAVEEVATSKPQPDSPILGEWMIVQEEGEEPTADQTFEVFTFSEDGTFAYRKTTLVEEAKAEQSGERKPTLSSLDGSFELSEENALTVTFTPVNKLSIVKPTEPSGNVSELEENRFVVTLTDESQLFFQRREPKEKPEPEAEGEESSEGSPTEKAAADGEATETQQPE